MLVGVPKEIKTHEYRVGLVPASVRELTHHGHDITVADNAESAVAEAENFLPEMILMDLELPPTADSPPHPNAGLDATRRIKSNESTSRIPIIALMAHTMAQHQQKIVDAGCDDFQE